MSANLMRKILWSYEYFFEIYIICRDKRNMFSVQPVKHMVFI